MLGAGWAKTLVQEMAWQNPFPHSHVSFLRLPCGWHRRCPGHRCFGLIRPSTLSFNHTALKEETEARSLSRNSGSSLDTDHQTGDHRAGLDVGRKGTMGSWSLILDAALLNYMILDKPHCLPEPQLLHL